jgi:hypothetical protein
MLIARDLRAVVGPIAILKQAAIEKIGALASRF